MNILLQVRLKLQLHQIISIIIGIQRLLKSLYVSLKKQTYVFLLWNTLNVFWKHVGKNNPDESISF